ncbi:hypothetical protein V3C41_00440 [Paenarthrobacter nicotinovorans]|uniref:Uncharacterized protein n=1 Tax=Paenarthrobacter nicotinovorans TaxID=29320 RepID=A0ABV0GLU4_PAENI
MLGFDRQLLWSSALVISAVAGSVAMAAAGVPLALSMLEMVHVLGLSIAHDERRGHKGRADALRRLEGVRDQ